jgi:hypothetical protein
MLVLFGLKTYIGHRNVGPNQIQTYLQFYKQAGMQATASA